MEQVCRICSNSVGNQLHKAREMAYGLREEFTYLECGKCGCLQLLDIPADMQKYYPSHYYSFDEHGLLKTFLRRRWAAHALGQTNWVGRLLSDALFPNRAMEAVRRSGAARTARILDVGCGSGRLLLDMAFLGFKDLTGADPFIDRDLEYANGVKVFKKELSELNAGFDLIMFHFSYEHLDHPAEVIRQVHRLLHPGGATIIRIPVTDSYAWRRYGVNWVNLDPPRHFFIHSFRSMDILARQFGLKITEIFQESGDDQFWGSEQFERGMPSCCPRSFQSSPVRRLLAWRKIRRYKAQAEECNRKNEGDLVCFRLSKAK